MHPLPPLSTTLQLQEGENFAEMQRGDEQEKGLSPSEKLVLSSC